MKPASPYTVLILFWLLNEAHARRINKSRIAQDAEHTNQACLIKDAQPSSNECITQAIEHETMNYANPASEPGIEVVASGEVPVPTEQSNEQPTMTDANPASEAGIDDFSAGEVSVCTKQSMNRPKDERLMISI